MSRSTRIARAAMGTLALAAALTTSVSAQEAADEPLSYHDAVVQSLQWRCIGPSRGGRVTAVAGVVGDRLTYYMGATGGGVWKTTDAGHRWTNLSDKSFKTGSVGAIAIAESDPNVIYVGMGEACVRGNFSRGDGVYRSLDAGKTWVHLGLDDTQQIGSIIVHPKNPDLVYVAALGHIFGPNEERGVYRSKDAGETWEKTLFVDEHTGAVDLAFDPGNPRTIYAATWQVSRTPWSLESGGAGSGLYRSTDAGDTWDQLTKGLPKGIKGKIGVTVSPVNPQRVWAIVEANNGGVFRSDDGGDNWRRINENRSLRQRAWYYTHIYADPEEENTVYVLNVGFHKSTDGGKTFTERIRVPHGDNHDLWIDPLDNRRMISGNDGGANVSLDAGKSWSAQDMQPTAQFYHVTVDNRFPYRVYGAQQDNSTASISHTNRLGGWRRDFYSVGGGESGYIAVRPDNPDIVYAGSYSGFLSRYDRGSRTMRSIMVWPENPMGWGVGALDYRFQWTFPIVLSPHDPNVLYVGSQFVHKSTDEGLTWETISPDLTVGDPDTLKASGGPITKDNTGVEYYATVFTIAESPLKPGLIWAGSDDGLIHVTTDGGGTWQNVTPPDMGEWPLISLIEASSHHADTCYVAVNRYKMDDMTPYIYKTTDRGETWTLVTNGIDDSAFVRAVREDPQREGLLFAGTETGVWFSHDAGDNWQSLQNELPAVPVTDLAIKDDDLVISTQGRSFWIIDDISPLREMVWDTEPEGAAMLKPALTYRTGFGSNVRVRYWLAEAPEDALTLEFLDEDGAVIKSFTGKPKPKKEQDEANPDAADTTADDSADETEASGDADDEEDQGADDSGRGKRPRAPAEQGLNSFGWDMRYPDAVEVPGAIMWGGSTRGPLAAPSDYQVRLTVGDETITQSFTIAGDPRVDTTPEEYQEQFDFLFEVRDGLNEANTAINTIRSVRTQIDETLARVKKLDEAQAIKDAGASIKTQLKAIEEELIQTRSKSSQDPLNFPIKLNNKIASLLGRGGGAYKPNPAVYAVFEKLRSRLDTQLAALKKVIDNDIPTFNEQVRESGVPAIVLDNENDKDKSD